MAHPLCQPALGLCTPTSTLKISKFGSERHRSATFLQTRLPRQNHAVFSALSDLRETETSTNRETIPDLTTNRSVNGSTRNPKNNSISLRAKITIRRKRRPNMTEQTAEQMDVFADLLGQNVAIQLISDEIDPDTRDGKRSAISIIKDWADKASVVADKVQYSAEILVEKNFGRPGAIIITNNHRSDFYLETISLEGQQMGTIYFPCMSWVHSEDFCPGGRVFFSNKVFLPDATPGGLRNLRLQELEAVRGNGKGMRQDYDRVYDYDLYNDLGDEDKSIDLARPILGGSRDSAYPRRCRTGRPPTKSDPSKESRVQGNGNPYVPRDESFEQIKQDSYLATTLKGLVQQFIPKIFSHFRDNPSEFESFTAIDRLYCEGIQLKKDSKKLLEGFEFLKHVPLPDMIRDIISTTDDQLNTILRYPQPLILSRDKFSWMQDHEFSRQALAGVNPCVIRALEVFPPVSHLDSKVYGDLTSALKEEHIINRLEGLTVDQAVAQKRIFVLDFHDTYMPFLNQINALEGRKSYASVTLFFLTSVGLLKPLAIELSLPSASAGSKGSRRVFTPGDDATTSWLWMLAKSHVNCNDAGYHQLVSHWLRTHACIEPIVIACHRQLSELHPLYKLLHPHLRYTMEINAAARQRLIPANGVIEGVFSPGRYAMQLSSAYYTAKWRFDEEALPKDLISRGVAERDPNSPHGLKLLINDYPFANDGLLIWSAIESWVTEYVSIYYGSDPESILEDEELQSWWTDIRTKGHADKQDEPWWPTPQNQEELVNILTTIMWLCSGFHAAVNFGQFGYAGYMPNKPTLTRRHIPERETPEYLEFVRNPQGFILSVLPSQAQATVLMAVVESLSTHSPDEEYLGLHANTNWTCDLEAIQAFSKFSEEIKAIDSIIKQRNEDPTLKNRHGAGILPYELLFPKSPPGITGRGVPNSISI